MEDPTRKRFIKDNGLPIPVTESPYFEYLIDLYEDLYGSKTAWENLQTKMSEYGNNTSALFAECNDISKKVIEVVESTTAYKQFNDSKNLLKEFDSQNLNLKGVQVYSRDHKDQYFISIDMSSANFNAFKYITEDLVLNSPTYPEFIMKALSQATDLKPIKQTAIDYFANSKFTRQVVFGHLNPKRQQKVQQFLIQQVIKTLVEKGSFEISKFISCTSDETVMYTTKEEIQDQMATIRTLLDTHLPRISHTLKIEGFQLRCMESKTGRVVGFVKEFVDDRRPDFKSVPAFLFAQVFKKYYGISNVTEFDKKFMYEGFLCTLDEDLF